MWQKWKILMSGLIKINPSDIKVSVAEERPLSEVKLRVWVMYMSVIFYSLFWWKGKKHVSLKVTANIVNLCVWSTWLFASFVSFSWLIFIWKWSFTTFSSVCERKRSLEDTVTRDRTGNVCLSLHHDFVPRWKSLYEPLIAQSRHRMFQAPVQSALHTVIISNWRAAIFFASFLYMDKENISWTCKWDQDGFWYLLSVCSAVNRKLSEPLKAKSKTWGATLNEISCSKALVVAKGIKPDQIL